MNPDRIDTLDLEPGAFQLIHEPAQRRRRVRAGEDVLVHEQAPDQVLVLPGFADAGDLQEEDAVVVEHVVDLFEKGGEVLDADVLGHLEAGDFVVAAGRNRDVAIVHAEDSALAFLNACLSQGVVAPCCLVSSEGDSRRVGSVGGAGVFGERSPTAANVEEGFALFESDLLAHDSEFVVL